MSDAGEQKYPADYADRCHCACHHEVTAIAESELGATIRKTTPVSLLDPIEMALSCHRCWSWHDRAHRRRPPAAA